MHSARAEAMKAQAAETVAKSVESILPRLDRIEALLNQLAAKDRLQPGVTSKPSPAELTEKFNQGQKGR